MGVRPETALRAPVFGLLLTALAACGGLQWPPSSTPGLANRPPANQTSLPRDWGGMVIVRRGDTLYSISLRHRVSTRALIEANNIQPPYTLTPGQRLKLPPPKEHVVRSGDTLYGISRQYGVDVSSLAKMNRLLPPYRIYVGQSLLLPAAVTPSVRVASAASAPSASAPPPAEQEARRSPAPRTVAKPPKAAGGGFGWPLQGKIVSRFGAKAGGLHNDGINIAAPKGAAVHAAENGVVAYAGNELRGFGNLLLIRHSGGWMTAYAHNETLLVRRGDRVKKGQVIARVGSTGNVSSPQLHFEIRRGLEAVNPLDHLSRQTADAS